ncbi:hypothetical protein HYV71_00460 [Candidatus Uhrbacteria bacterium]|nr:hypothetical protein [Candidatus Uhrbacteria bacterium]
MTIIDFLYSVLATAIIIVAVFVSIALYHLIVILKRIHSLCDLVEDKTERFLQTFHDLAGKLCGLKATVDVFAGVLKTIVQQIAEKNSLSKRKPKKSSRNDSASISE